MNANKVRRFLAGLVLGKKICVHPKMEVIDVADDGVFMVHCAACETAWLAPCIAEGVSCKVTEAALARGCRECQQRLMKVLKEEMPDTYDYTCPDCGEEWSLHKEKRTVV